MHVAIYVLLAMLIACSSNSSNRRNGDATATASATAAVGEDETAGAVQKQSQGSLTPDQKITFSTYAEVTAADVLEIVVRVDSELDTQQKEKLAAGIDALLKHVINSSWSIAVTDLDTTAYPTQFITKYANYADYGKKFAAALGVGKADEQTTDPQQKQASETEQPTPQWAVPKPSVALRAFILVTDQSLAYTKLATDKAVLADTEDALPTKVYAILNTADGIDDYLNWKNARDKNVLSRYGSLQADYASMLEDFSADIANTLRGIFIVPPTPSGAEDVAIAQLKVFNVPETAEAKDKEDKEAKDKEDKEAKDGFIHDSHYQVKERRIFTRAKFVEGTCVDVTLAQ